VKEHSMRKVAITTGASSEGTRVRRPGCSFRSTFRISPSATFAKAARTVGGWWVPSVPSAATTHPSEGWVT
jgi:hypothetical protein